MVQLKYNKIDNTIHGIRHNVMYTNYFNKKYNNHIITDVNNILHGYRGNYIYGISCYNKSLLITGRPTKYVTDEERSHAKNEQNKGYYHRDKCNR
jgi:hypothetical protein